MDIGDILRELGLQQYEAAFRDNRIDIRVLPKLTAEDLKDLGVTLVGDRRMLLDAIAALREPTARGVKVGGDVLDTAYGAFPRNTRARGDPGSSLADEVMEIADDWTARNGIDAMGCD